MSDDRAQRRSADDASVPSAPLADADASITPGAIDPAQAEWEGLISENGEPRGEQSATATGDDPAQIPADDDDIPAEDIRPGFEQPESQGADPEIADIGDEGEGDLSPEDL